MRRTNNKSPRISTINRPVRPQQAEGYEDYSPSEDKYRIQDAPNVPNSKRTVERNWFKPVKKKKENTPEQEEKEGT
jgi:hypothetical protein